MVTIDEKSVKTITATDSFLIYDVATSAAGRFLVSDVSTYLLGLLNTNTQDVKGSVLTALTNVVTPKITFSDGTVMTTNAGGSAVGMTSAGDLNFSSTGGVINFITNSVTRLTISNTGIATTTNQVSINGTIPSWSSSWGVAQIGNYASISSIKSGTGGNSICAFSHNAYYNGSVWKYIQADYAANYYQSSGTHVFRVTGTGSADATITWIDSLTISATGYLSLGLGFSSAIKTTNTTASTSVSTGSGIFGGGVGIAGATYIGGLLNVAGDICSAAFADISSGCTVVGWAATPTVTVFGKKQGNTAELYGKITGTSNSIYVYFDVPTAFRQHASLAAVCRIPLKVVDNGTEKTTGWGYFDGTYSNGRFWIFPDVGASNWTASGTKTVFFSMTYETQ